MNKHSEKVSLSKLYKSKSIRNTIRDALEPEFADSFNRLIKEAVLIRSQLVNTAKAHKSLIRELVIEYGYQFETLEDLRICLEQLGVCVPADEVDLSIDVVDCGCNVLRDINQNKLESKKSDSCEISFDSD